MNQLIVMEKDVLSKDILQPTCQIVTTGCRERRASGSLTASEMVPSTVT